MVSTSPLDNILKELSLVNQNIEQMQESLTGTLAGISSQLSAISQLLNTKFPLRAMRGRISPQSVVHSSDDIEDEEEELRDVETDILKLFRKMNRVRTRKFPLEKIQSEIEAVRSLKSSFCISFLYISLCISFKPKASLGTKVD